MNSIVQRWNADCSVTGKTLDNRFPQLVIGLLRDCVVRYQTIVVHPPRSNLRGDFLSSSFCQKRIATELVLCDAEWCSFSDVNSVRGSLRTPNPVQKWSSGMNPGASLGCMKQVMRQSIMSHAKARCSRRRVSGGSLPMLVNQVPAMESQSPTVNDSPSQKLLHVSTIGRNNQHRVAACSCGDSLRV